MNPRLYLRQGYRGIKFLAIKEYRKGNYVEALSKINVCATLATQFNWIYADDDLENLLAKISKSTINRVNNYSANPNRWVLYDDFCLPYVLVIQWLKALAESGKEILYIVTRDIENQKRKEDILYVADKYVNIKVVIIPQGDTIARAQNIYNSIVEFQPSKLILHKLVISPIQLALCSLPKQITRYIINLSDQTFWLGSKAIDYVLEFRQFGASVSQQRRGILPSQQLMVPFYPANDENEFQGLPNGCLNGKLIIFSGGDYYKTIDKNHTYWDLVKSILEAHQDVNFLYIVKCNPEGDAEIRNFISKYHFEDRFFFSQFRQDIYQIFAHCDIYMGTCPTSGSLMSQLAAVNGKPILQYYTPGTPDDETEQALCFNESFKISYNSKEEFLNEADRLISDRNYRKEQGERLRKAMITPDQFNDLVIKTLESNKTQLEIKTYSIDYKKELDNRWLELEIQGYTNAKSYILGTLGKRYSLLFTPYSLITTYIFKALNIIFKNKW